jgi:putative FmdB family regulatory protein
MPIYDYRCTSCGFEKEYLQKVSDPVMTLCPQCQQETFVKKLTAAGFQLKGSGWYATDFRNGGAQKPAGAESKPDAKADAGADTKGDGKSESKSETQGETKSGGDAKSDSGSKPAPASGAAT